MIETEICHDAVHPGVEGALEAEIAEMTIGLKKCFLVDVLGLSLRAGQMQREPQHRLVVLTHELFERSARAALRFAYEVGIVDAVEGVAHHGTARRNRGRDRAVLSSLHSPRLTCGRHACITAEGDLAARHCG